MAEQPGNIPNPTTPPASKSSQGSATLCPYCGNVQISGDRCQNCKGLFEPLSRQATQICMGPWFIRDTRNPFKPGCSYDVIVKMVKGGKIRANSVMRGPTTMQFWQVARNVPGIAHLLGSCHECNTEVSPQDAACPKCGKAFDSLATRNELGLLYRTDEEARTAQDALDKQMSGEGIPAAAGQAGAAASGAQATGGDLLTQVLGAPTPAPSKIPSGVPAPGQAAGSPVPPAAVVPPAQPQVPGAAAAVPGAPVGQTGTPAAPVQAASYETFDFGPAEASDGLSVESPPQDFQKRPGLSLGTYLLIGVNGVVLVLIILIFWMMSKPEGGSTPTTTDGSDSGEVDGSLDGGGDGSSDGGPSSSTDGATDSASASTGASDGTSADNAEAKWDQQWSAAMRLEQSDDLEGAYIRLNRLKDAPDEQRRKKLAVALDRVTEKRRRAPGESKIFN